MTNDSYSFQKISEIIGGKMIEHLPVERWNARYLLVDSRKTNDPDSSLFIALGGERHNGHHYIKELFDKGVRHFIVSELSEANKALPANFILVPDTLEALQKIAAYHRSRFSIPVIGITGSNGKTMVKEWLFQLLSPDKNIVRSPKSYNSQVGVPLSVWQMSDENEIAIFEAGISRPGEMEKLEAVIKPTIGIFTNIGQAHDENFTGPKEKINEKLKLFSSTGAIIWCKDYTVLTEEIESKPFCEGKQLFSWSKKSNAPLLISKVARMQAETRIQGIYKNDFIELTIPFTDEASVENAIQCWVLMLHLEYDHEVIAERMALLSPVAMRLEMKEGINNCSVINDSYNSDLGSLSIALDFLNQQKQHPKKTLILSDILQSGRNDEALYREVSELVSGKGVNRLIGIGEAITSMQKTFRAEKMFFKTTDDFLRDFPLHDFSDETILLKGARVFGFERISKALQQKAHQTVLEINLNALIQNLNFFRSRLKPETKIMAMVKAFSYGSGTFEIANVMQFHRVDYLAVAYADEGVELRKKGITLPILVMNPEEQSFDTMLQHKLEPEIYSFRMLGQFAEAAKKAVRFRKELVVSVHLKIDTGMHRLGFEEDEIPELLARIKNFKFLKIQSVFSHLVASEDSKHDEFTRQQAALFSRVVNEIQSQVSYPVPRHILNSSGIIRFPEYQLEMVRLGIGLYGIAPTIHEQKQLQNVGTLRTTISQIRSVSAGETIGYSRQGVAEKNINIATVAIGYADGISRKLGNGAGKMLVNGKFAHTIGNICMDMCMLDITDIPANEGDEVIVFGNDYPVYQFAKDAGMIPYEVLTGISQRVKRIYFQE